MKTFVFAFAGIVAFANIAHAGEGNPTLKCHDSSGSTKVDVQLTTYSLQKPIDTAAGRLRVYLNKEPGQSEKAMYVSSAPHNTKGICIFHVDNGFHVTTKPPVITVNSDDPANTRAGLKFEPEKIDPKTPNEIQMTATALTTAVGTVGYTIAVTYEPNARK